MPVVFKDSDGGGLNDCEKRTSGRKARSLGLERRLDSRLPRVLPWDELHRRNHQENADPFNNGITKPGKAQRGMPIDIDSNKVKIFKPYDYSLVEVGRTDQSIDYAIEIKDIPVIGDGKPDPGLRLGKHPGRQRHPIHENRREEASGRTRSPVQQ